MICRLHCASASGRLTAHQGARRPGILVADDEACVREWLRAALQRHGFRVWLAADGEQAIDLYRRRRSEIVLVLLDVRMPVLNGPQTLARLRQMNPTVLCCFMSGNGAEYACSNLPARVITKPFRLADLLETLPACKTRVRRA